MAGSTAREKPILGIDLGTTNTCVAHVRNRVPRVVPTDKGSLVLPSVVALSEKGDFLVGGVAKDQMVTNPRNTIYGAKRLIGRKFNSKVVQELRSYYSYDIVEGPSGEAAVRLGGEVRTLPQISALVLGHVKKIAEAFLGREMGQAIISVPAYYNDNQRQAVKEAGRLAGFEVKRIVNEPTAAALAYGFNRGLDQKVLVYDLGGGTFDVSVLQLSANVFEVLATGGDTFLGGVDFDNRIVERLLEAWKEKTGAPFAGDRVALSRLVDAAERAKCALSERAEFPIHLPFLALERGQPVSLDTTLTRAEVVSMVEPLVDRTIEVCREVLAAKKLGAKDIHEVLLVGGQSRMPLVHEKVAAFFGRQPSRSVHPDEAVAIGAALLAHSLDSADGVVLIDVLPLSIGIASPQGKVRTIFERNTPLPAHKRVSLATTHDGQTEFELAVVQGDAPVAADCEYLGTVRLDGLPSGPRGMVKIAVGFELGAECLLTITARELQTNRAVQTSFAARAPPARQVAPAATGEARPEVASASPCPRPKSGLLGLLSRLLGRQER